MLIFNSNISLRFPFKCGKTTEWEYKSEARRLVFLIIMVMIPCFFSNARDQNEIQKKIDSLKHITETSTNDTLVLKALKEWDNLIYVSDPKMDFKLNLKMKSIAERNLGTLKSFEQRKPYLNALSSCLSVLGLIYIDEGKYDLAIDYFTKGLKIDKELKNESGIAAFQANIGIVYKDLKDYERAIDYFKNALSYYKESHDLKSQSIVLANLGIIYYSLGKLNQALEIYFESLRLRQKTNDLQGMAYSYSNIGAVYSEWKKNDSALYYYDKSLVIRRSIDDKQGIAGSLVNIGNIWIELKDYRKAEPYFLEALELSKSVYAVVTIRDAAFGLYRCEKEKGNFRNALEKYELFTSYNDSLESKENQRSIIRHEIQSNFERRSIEDSLKHAKTAEISKAKIEKQKVELQARRNTQYFLFSGLALVIIFSLFIYNRFRITKKQKGIIEIKEKESNLQRQIIEDKQKEILDSINYAKKIQYTLLAHDEFLAKNLPNYFVLFKPKDIVSGDFYWATKKADDFYLAVCDSTGHGVPGAFMSLLNISFLNEAINEKNIREPHAVFNHIRDQLIKNIEGARDGMDGVLIRLSGRRLQYAAAYNAPVLIRNGQLMELQADKMPVGAGDIGESFSLNEVELISGDQLYFYTDGFADQFGGQNGKKFKFRNLQQLFLRIQHENPEEQRLILEKSFNSWKGNLEQVDDVCVIGIKL